MNLSIIYINFDTGSHPITNCLKKNMKLARIKTLVVVFITCLWIIGCSKSGGNNPPNPPAEENLAITIDPDPGAAAAKALSATYDFKILINSQMPAQGVEGTVVFKRESDNTTLSSQNISGNSSPINVTISNIALSEVGIVTISVKSKSKPANTAAKTFKLQRK